MRKRLDQDILFLIALICSFCYLLFMVQSLCKVILSFTVFESHACNLWSNMIMSVKLGIFE